jgi:hypothetical protein
MRLSMWRVLPAMLALLVLTGPASLRAMIIVTDESTFTFSGLCTDCQGNATATLVLQNYVQDNAIEEYNLISFHYDGTNLHDPFTITAGDEFDIEGVIPASLTAPAFFHISSSSSGEREEFYSLGNGNWRVGALNPADYGTNGLWNSVPEPGAFLLVVLGMAVMGVRRWQVRN